ncbi:MAG: hypothetical protein MRT15_04090 [archaeon YNP-LCB-003-016]|uniref:hypothetical protein n=1 Tax=Candidatus Culexarchaeum yellowstonense TaxID=2928963 RepID=UPI0026F13C4F|nr:hypothetical protein [Candidatus Culexarchaeum yellowstonense]MCR6691548.1 hypothetical protein [Candidatus Culexarchaeum yellowstonense]
MLKGVGKIVWVKGKRSYYIHVPEEVALDSAFPFRRGEKVLIEIDLKNRSLIISHWRGE